MLGGKFYFAMGPMPADRIRLGSGKEETVYRRGLEGDVHKIKN